MKKSVYYQDILYYIDTKLALMLAELATLNNADNDEVREFFAKMAERRQKEINKWMSEEVED